MQNSTGGVLSSFDSFLLIRVIKTLALRMGRHNSNAKIVSDIVDDLKRALELYNNKNTFLCFLGMCFLVHIFIFL
ncbi:PLP-dependent transferase [Clostridium estertheticum]|nr:PLP-dependent transferase [Clostridium estertheticum]WLC86187.1 PLP-dependent transferase [Clostridium estertheticum]